MTDATLRNWVANKVPKMVFQDCLKLINGFAIPFVTADFNMSEGVMNVDVFDQSGKRTRSVAKIPLNIPDFIETMSAICGREAIQANLNHPFN